MPKAVTLTMNPSLDLSVLTDEVVPEHKVRTEPPREDPGGGGVNVARVLHRLGAETVAVMPRGGPAGERLIQRLEAEAVPVRTVPVDGSTRTNLAVREREGRQFRFLLPGPEMSAEERRRCLEAVLEALAEGDVLVASGSLPPGVPEDFYAELTRRGRERGAVVVLDAKGPWLQAALAEKPHWIKPNHNELGAILEVDRDDDEALHEGARQLVAERTLEHLLLSRGSKGATYFDAEQVVKIPSPEVKVRSVIGAGDSMVAGLVWALLQGRSPVAASRAAVAAGGAAVLTPGTELLRPDDFKRLLRETEAEGADAS